jgi:peptidoglycan/xylan/chitin deacetylase (PgdA/CDA1 family)
MDLSQLRSVPPSYRYYRLALQFIRASGIDGFFDFFLPSRGVIFALHRVRPLNTHDYQPNLSLEITPEFLDEAIAHVKSLGFNFISLDEALLYMAKKYSDKFAVMTFDDGYYDTVEYALPILEKHKVPAIVYIVPGYVNRETSLWWLTLEEAIRTCSSIVFPHPKGHIRFKTNTFKEKQQTFRKIHSQILNLPNDLVVNIISDIACQAHIKQMDICHQNCLGWKEINQLSHHPLITIGAHSLTHARLSKCNPLQMENEMVQSRRIIESKINKPVGHFSYPNGTKENAGTREFLSAKKLGFKSATTVRPSLIYPEHIHCPTALPRVSLNGYFQSTKILGTMMSGAPFLLKNLSTGIAFR